jgi:drug/metabolite transporter (DMT)-like permease
MNTPARPGLSHAQAVGLMLLATLMWSIAGVVARQLEAARSFEVTFWRSAFNALALVLLLAWLRGPAPLWRTLRQGGRALWLSGLCWSVMFTAFMVALTLTTVANVLVTMALAPLFTALAARLALKRALPRRTWVAVAVAGAGIVWMYGQQFAAGEARLLLGTVVALAVPLAAAVNWTLLQHLGSRAQVPDMLPAVLLGALISAAATLPLALPFSASGSDLGWLALLGVVQLAIPCLLVVTVARVLPAPELALLAQLEVIFGVLWAWLGAGEVPTGTVLAGGALVLGALAANEALALRGSIRARTGQAVAPSG